MATRYECGICWTVYDPACGDEVAQISAGTAFQDLPHDWHCPTCGAPKAKFLALAEATTGPSVVLEAATVAATVKAAYLTADETMRGLPVHNPRLGFETLGFRTLADAHVGIAITPWCMVIVRVPFRRPEGGEPGATVTRSFPSGEYDFVTGELGSAGAVETCSLFSPMHEFAEPAAARKAAEAALAALFTPPPQDVRKPPTRRSLLFGGAP